MNRMTEGQPRPFSAASFYAFLGEKRLMASRCTKCQNIHLPPRAICPACFSDQLAWAQLSGKGSLVAYTVISIGPTFLNRAGYGRERPYVTGIVQLEEGVRISARILGMDGKDPQSIQIGAPLTFSVLEEGPHERAAFVLAFQPA